MVRSRQAKKIEQSNTCGIVGLSLGWLVPLAGVVLGIIALCRNEKSRWIGITSICIAVVFWMIWVAVMWGEFQ